MSPNPAFVEEIMTQSRAALSRLEQLEAIRSFVETGLPIPRPYLGSGEIRLVIIGQDPTVQQQQQRAGIKTVLNLDKRGGLNTYLAQLCQDLGLSLANVYATNACKNFFVQPPTAIKEVNVLAASAPVWLPILQAELARFPNALVISLGEPVLSMLVKPCFPREMKYYWGYHRRWREGKSNPMRPIAADESTVDRIIFPFVHQPTIRSQRAEFYRVKRRDYLGFIRQKANSGKSFG
jgi:uracil-DNA glycosylase